MLAGGPADRNLLPGAGAGKVMREGKGSGRGGGVEVIHGSLRKTLFPSRTAQKISVHLVDCPETLCAGWWPPIAFSWLERGAFALPAQPPTIPRNHQRVSAKECPPSPFLQTLATASSPLFSPHLGASKIPSCSKSTSATRIRRKNSKFQYIETIAADSTTPTHHRCSSRPLVIKKLAQPKRILAYPAGVVGQSVNKQAGRDPGDSLPTWV
jgi:hypothetical protein